MKRDPGLDVLVDLNGTEYTEENGYWYKIEARMVNPTKDTPRHSIQPYPAQSLQSKNYGIR